MKKKYFVLAAIFLFNPLISIFDILPDFIGYYFLLRAFTPMSYIFDNASDLYDSVKRMMIIGIAKFFSVVLLFVTDTTMALVLSFSFAIVEILYGIGMFTKLFDVTSYVRMRYDSDARTERAEKMKSFSIFFLIAKVAFALMPDLTALTIGNSDLGKVNLTRFRPLLFLASAVIMLVIGSIWLARFVRFFKSAFSDALIERVGNEYDQQKLERPGIFEAKDFMFSIKLLCIGSIFLFDISIDNISFFMDAVFSVLCIIAVRLLVKRGYVSAGKNEKRLFTVASIHAILNFSNFIYSLIYFKHGDMFFVYRESEELFRYLPIELLTVAESALLIIEIFMIFKLLNGYTVPIIRKYRRYFAERSVDGFIDEFKDRSRRACKIAFILAVIAIVYFSVYTAIRPLNESFVIGNYLTSIICIIYFNRAMGYISDRVYLTVYKYS
ncbi:MAG: hypothetical protein IKC74_06675 [Clostridia bacterium]|nr:hypothetical protein [Clostridia bacterium]